MESANRFFYCRDLDEHGKGIGRLNNNKICFVPGLLPGEKAEIKIIQQKKKYAIGKIIKIKQTSPERTIPRCDFFPQCGGCQLLHLTYQGQLKIKRKKVTDALKRIGGIKAFEAAPVLASPATTRYRNKASLPAGGNSKKPLLGFYKLNSHQIININECLMCNKDLGAILTIVKKHISRNKIPLYKREKNSGLFRYLICRSSGYEKKHMLIFVLTAYNIDPLLPMLKELIALKNIKSFYINLNRKKTAEISGKKNILIHGDDHLVETVDNYYYRISPDSFFQINTAQTAVLYNEAEKMLPLSRNMILADLYCGTGTLTVRLAKKVKKVYGIEKNSNAVKDAAVNSNLNNAANAEFLNAEAAAGLKELCSYKKKPDAVILNPPRTGCSRSVLNTIIKNEIRYILYISCKPSTQARDLKILTQQNYVLLKCRPLDMFPHTTLVENIILMERK